MWEEFFVRKRRLIACVLEYFIYFIFLSLWATLSFSFMFVDIWAVLWFVRSPETLRYPSFLVSPCYHPGVCSASVILCFPFHTLSITSLPTRPSLGTVLSLILYAHTASSTCVILILLYFSHPTVSGIPQLLGEKGFVCGFPFPKNKYHHLALAYTRCGTRNCCALGKHLWLFGVLARTRVRAVFLLSGNTVLSRPVFAIRRVVEVNGKQPRAKWVW